MSEGTEILKEISKKLSQLIVLWKISNAETIENWKKEIKKDELCKKILELANGQLSSSLLKQEVMASCNVSEATVKRRLRQLVDFGAVVIKRTGNEIYYDNSGLYD